MRKNSVSLLLVENIGNALKFIVNQPLRDCSVSSAGVRNHVEDEISESRSFFDEIGIC